MRRRRPTPRRAQRARGVRRVDGAPWAAQKRGRRRPSARVAAGVGISGRTAAQPLITTPMPVIDTAFRAGENVAEKLAPDAGVVPVASPSDALPAPLSVIL